MYLIETYDNFTLEQAPVNATTDNTALTGMEDLEIKTEEVEDMNVVENKNAQQQQENSQGNSQVSQRLYLFVFHSKTGFL